MSLTFRMLPPTNPIYQTVTANGRVYTGTPGNAYDIPDIDAAILASNGWIKVCPSGPTASRPTTNPNTNSPYLAAPGAHFWDTTLSAIAIWDGATYRSPAGASI